MNPPPSSVRLRASQFIPTLAMLIISYPLLNHFADTQVAEIPLGRLTEPVMLLLGAVLLSQLLSYFLTGIHLRAIKGSLLLMAWTLAAVPVLVEHPRAKALAPLEQPLIWLISIYALYKVARCWTQESEALETTLQVTVLTTMAFLLSRQLPKVWPTGRLTLKLGSGTVTWSLSQAIIFALLMVAAFRSASLIRLAENKLLRVVGESLKNSAFFQFVCFNSIFIYSHDLRPTLARRFGTHLALFEWGAAAFILAVVLGRMQSRLKKLPDGVTVDQLARHLQDLSLTSDDELAMVSRLISAFVDRGDRTGIATYLIAEAARLNISMTKVQEMASRLLQYNDARAPGLTTYLEGRARERRNREQRLILLQATVKDFREIAAVGQPTSGK